MSELGSTVSMAAQNLARRGVCRPVEEEARVGSEVGPASFNAMRPGAVAHTAKAHAGGRLFRVKPSGREDPSTGRLALIAADVALPAHVPRRQGATPAFTRVALGLAILQEANMKRLLTLAVALALMTPAAFAQDKMGTREVVVTKDAPQPIGPYSQAIKGGGFIFASGQIALDPATGKLVEGDIKAQTERVLKNLSAVLRTAGSSMDRVV